MNAQVKTTLLSYMLEMHRFFTKESKSFIGTWSKRYKIWIFPVREIIYCPMAYCKFMWYSYEFYLLAKKNSTPNAK